jgi:hypothetical protein
MRPLRGLAELSRAELLPVALETMLLGHLLDRALMPQVVLRTKRIDDVEPIAIDEWMGASPVYTRRMRALMGIEGDDVGAIMKALQLDVGFVHEYMDVRWKLVDARHGEFWLAHCGALMDVEPHGERRVVGMCHHIEDPTFDATAYATNPRARIRPLHRPPRVPADRRPHCHWTITIDPANAPVSAAAHTARVAALPLAAVENPRPPDPEPGGWTDYRAPFDPGFRLSRLSHGALLAVAREFALQSHLLSCSAELALAARYGDAAAGEMIASQWVGSSWVASERLARALAIEDRGAAAVGAVLLVHPSLPPGFARRVEVDAERVRLTLRARQDDLLDPAHPGWLGLVIRGEARGLEAMAGAVEPRARVTDLAVRDGALCADIRVDPAAARLAEPSEAVLVRLSGAASWVFRAAS